MVFVIKAKETSRNRDPKTQLFTQSAPQPPYMISRNWIHTWSPNGSHTSSFSSGPAFRRPLLSKNITWRHKSLRSHFISGTFGVHG